MSGGGYVKGVGTRPTQMRTPATDNRGGHHMNGRQTGGTHPNEMHSCFHVREFKKKTLFSIETM